MIEGLVTMVIFMALAVVSVYIATVILDWFDLRAAKRNAQHAVDDAFRQDRARQIMKGWTDDIGPDHR